MSGRNEHGQKNEIEDGEINDDYVVSQTRKELKGDEERHSYKYPEASDGKSIENSTHTNNRSPHEGARKRSRQSFDDYSVDDDFAEYERLARRRQQRSDSEDSRSRDRGYDGRYPSRSRSRSSHRDHSRDYRRDFRRSRSPYSGSDYRHSRRSTPRSRSRDRSVYNGRDRRSRRYSRSYSRDGEKLRRSRSPPPRHRSKIVERRSVERPSSYEDRPDLSTKAVDVAQTADTQTTQPERTAVSETRYVYLAHI